MICIGLDLSLQKTGIAVLHDKDLVDSSLVKSKPNGDKPIDEMHRLRTIVESIGNVVFKYQPDLVVIENLAFMARNTSALVQLSALNYMVRGLLVDDDIKWVVVAPTTLKKFVTGKGNSDKNIMMMEVYKQYGHTFSEDNTMDAFALSALGMALLGQALRKLTVPQKQVIELLQKQL